MEQLTRTDALLEREAELAEIDAALETVAAGSGGLALIEGPAGLGKSRLVAAACERGRDVGLTVLRARAGEIERDLPWGVVRSLFEKPLTTGDVDERHELLEGAAALSLRVLGDEQLDGEGDTLGAILHGLYWLAANLARRSPLLIAVDDVHWADMPSLRWILYLAARLEDLPVALVLGTRDAEPGANIELLRGVRSHDWTRVIRPGTLSPSATKRLVDARFEERVDGTFAAACFGATAGNPFLLNELIAQLRAESVDPTTANAERVHVVKPGNVARAVLLRLARESAAAKRLAAAVAVLGTDVRLLDAAAVAELDEAEAGAAADALAELDVLAPGTPLEFVHPLIRHVVREELPPLERQLMHLRAARVLDERGRAADEVAVHLLNVDARDDDWVVARLHAAGRAATGRGAPEVAINYLRRALAEAREADARAEVLRDLGMAEVTVHGTAGLARLQEALALSEDARRRGEIALDIGRFLRACFYSREAAQAYEQGLAGLDAQHDRALRAQLQIELTAAATLHLETAPLAAEHFRRLREEHGDAVRDDPALLATAACMYAASMAPAARGAELGRLAIAAGGVEAEDPEGWDPARSDDAAFQAAWANQAACALIWADQNEEAYRFLSRYLASAERRGYAIARMWSTTHLTRAAFRLGHIREAEAAAREGLALMEEQGWAPAPPYALGPLTDALIELGAPDDAQTQIERHGLDGDVGGEWACNEFLYSRGQLRLVQGEFQAALDDFLECGRRLEAWAAARNPGIAPWRSGAALALRALDGSDEAKSLAAEGVALAREFETPRALGIALRAHGLVLGGALGLDLLAEAVTVLENTQARLERARALVDLGAALRRAGKSREALDALRDGLDLAAGCGATVLAERAREELVSAGARPRRDALRGRDALTASELRVARMAAGGATNREIAQALFITQRTVETHLTHAYQKLDVSSRADLPAAMS